MISAGKECIPRRITRPVCCGEDQRENWRTPLFALSICQVERQHQFRADNALRSYGAALKEIGAIERQEMGRRKNNRAESSHLPFRRRERALIRFRRMMTLQKFASVHSQVHNHFSQERHLLSRKIYKEGRAGASAAWRLVMA